MKKYRLMAATLALTGIMGMTSYAGTWESNAQGWWYNNGNGTWPASTWEWIDGNNDGIAECYYFDPNGYCLQNANTPDGYLVNDSGAWVVNGIVQTKSVSADISNSLKNIKETNISELEPVTSWAFYHFDSEETAAGSIWNDGYAIMNDGYVEYKLDKKYSELSLTAIDGMGNSMFLKGGEYTLSILGDNDTVLGSYNIIDDVKKAKDIKVNVSGQEYVTLRWGSKENSNSLLLMKNIKLK